MPLKIHCATDVLGSGPSLRDDFSRSSAIIDASTFSMVNTKTNSAPNAQEGSQKKRTLCRLVLIYTLKFTPGRLCRLSRQARPADYIGGMLPAEILHNGHVQLEELKSIESLISKKFRWEI